MPTQSHTNTSGLIEQLAQKVGLSVAAADSGTDFTGAPTARLRLKSGSGNSYAIETSEGLGGEIARRPQLRDPLSSYLEALAKRMHAARPDVFLTLNGLPLSLVQFS